MTTPYPTLENLSVEWAIEGDDNLNGVVAVRYREAGAAAWRNAMPLRRVPAGSNEGFAWTNKHSGSILDLTPDTLYEIELTLSDPDGGSTSRTITQRTRAVPAAAPGGTVKPVTPGTFSAAASSAQPGDILVLEAGSYSGFTFGQDGTSNALIVIRAAQPGDAIVNGDVRLDGRSHVMLQNLTVNGMVKFNNAHRIVVQRCTIHTTHSGIVSMSSGVSEAYIADNTVLGPTGWSNETVGASGDNLGEGIELTGPGNVICYNFVKGFRDAISTLEDAGAYNQVSVDIYNNDIAVGADDAIEADFTMGNCRVMRNRICNSFVGLSSQPGLGGPAYFIRNVMYNIIYSPFKLYRGSVGDVAYHNTVIKCGDALRIIPGRTWSHARFRNNLFIGGEGGGTYGGYGNGNGRVAYLTDVDSTCALNFDGYASIGTGTFEGSIAGTSFSSLAQMRANTTEHDAVEVDMSIFAAAVAFPATGPFPERAAPDLRLEAGCAAADAGEPIHNVNDGYAGSAPDLGAYEIGAPLPHYGPRPADDAPPTRPAGLSLKPTD
ncbi:MAG: right-handed parallel beta-helix repeat-containing protein [Kiritimatiellae bacterium]|nr:right-handed parallel beta-helix repeat-containing protein [Kiritimatiellia bacterium]